VEVLESFGDVEHEAELSSEIAPLLDFMRSTLTKRFNDGVGTFRWTRSACSFLKEE
jgi:hypothetical protein